MAKLLKPDERLAGGVPLRRLAGFEKIALAARRAGCARRSHRAR
eukprot:gene7061-10891_t